MKTVYVVEMYFADIDRSLGTDRYASERIMQPRVFIVHDIDRSDEVANIAELMMPGFTVRHIGKAITPPIIYETNDGWVRV